MDLLPKRGSNAFKLFCDALIATDQEDVVCNFLQKKTNTEALSTSSASMATASVLSSPLSQAVAETPDIALPSSAPQSLLGRCTEAGPSASFASSVQESDLPLLDPPTTPQKRKPVASSAECAESEDKFHPTLNSPSETDSSPAKRVCSDSGSVICIRGGSDSVIKIYNPAVDERGDSSTTKLSAVQESVTFPSLVSSSQKESEEIRHVMKHFILKDRGADAVQDDHIHVAKSLLSSLPQEYLKLVSEPHLSPSKVRREMEDFGSGILRERLSRCDSTGMLTGCRV